ncbi:raffinose synthase or seed imbibition protein Sip1-domain-containing protein [Scenedesmus sp. NREL 46B-D3]|nr:raffinose synthase or seed imbibition protein Sip1-domain-containing protein [Scenedesmus sp. NREL 46B-D3]
MPHQQRQVSMANNRTDPASFPGLLELHLQNNIVCSSDGTTILKSLGSGVAVSAGQQLATASTTAAPTTPGLLLDISSGDPAAPESAVPLGEVCGSAFLACARIKLCWMSPYHASSIAGLPGHIQFMLLQLDPAAAAAAAAGGGGGEGGGNSKDSKAGLAPMYATILPLLPDGCKATLQPAKVQPASGNLLAVHFDSGNPNRARSSWQQAVYIAAGSDPFALVDASVAAAAAIAGGARPRWEKQVPDICSSLGWCTWDAFYHSVSGWGIQQGLEGFRAADPARVPRWLIIDDGWQRTGLDGDAHQQQQQQQQQQPVVPKQQQQQQQPALGSGPHSHPLPDAAGKATAAATAAVAGWSLLLSGLRTPLLSGVLVRLLKAFNVATSEHSKRLLSPEFNAKFSNLTAGPQPETSSTASAAEAAAVIAALKQRYNLKRIYAWHAILGYWSGVSPAATAAAPAAAAAAAFGAASDMLAAPAAAAAAAAARGPDGRAEPDAAAVAAAAEAAVRDLAAAAAGGGKAASSSSSSSNGVASSVVLPRVSAAMTDLEPPCNWSQLVLAGIAARVPGFLGIDGVKVDVQNQLELAGSAAGQPGGPALAAAWHAALEASVRLHLPGNQLINCMCHNTNNLYRMTSSNLARVSDDFYPHLPASHAPHVAVCAFNSLFMGAVATPDWDMFHSRHPRALLHATARMISGGPVYVSDKPGAHDSALLARLALPGGALLQPLLPGRPTRDCLFIDPCRDGASVLKVWSRNSCNGVVAAFNLQGSSWSRSKLKFVAHDSTPPTLSTRIAPGDVEGLQRCLPATCLSSSSSSSAHHDPQQHAEGPAAAAAAAAAGDVATVAPLLELHSSSSSSSSSISGSDGSGSCIKFAVVGLMNMLNPGGAVTNISVGSGGSSSSSSRAAGSDGGSSSDSSDSWVVAEGGESAAAMEATDGGNGRQGAAKDSGAGSAAAAAAAGVAML